jgi:hypothetical protein
MPLIDHLLGNQTIRKAIWRLSHPFLTKRLQAEGVVFLHDHFVKSAEPAG